MCTRALQPVCEYLIKTEGVRTTVIMFTSSVTCDLRTQTDRTIPNTSRGVLKNSHPTKYLRISQHGIISQSNLTQLISALFITILNRYPVCLILLSRAPHTSALRPDTDQQIPPLGTSRPRIGQLQRSQSSGHHSNHQTTWFNHPKRLK